MNYMDKHYGDVTKWIETIIDSCETWDQTKTAFRLISNFEQGLMTSKDYLQMRWYTTEHLYDKLEKTREKIFK